MGSKQTYLGMDLQMDQSLFLEQIKFFTRQILEESSQRIINTLCGKKDDLQLHEQLTKQEREDNDRRSTQGNTDLESTHVKEDSEDLKDSEEMKETFSNLTLDRSMYKLISQEILLEKGHISLETSLRRFGEDGGPQESLRRGMGSYTRGQSRHDKEETLLRRSCKVSGCQESLRKGMGSFIRGQLKHIKEDEHKGSDCISKNFKKRKKFFRDAYVVAL